VGAVAGECVCVCVLETPVWRLLKHVLCMKKEEKKKNYIGSETTPSVNLGKDCPKEP